MQTVKKYPNAVFVAAMLISSTLTGCGQKGALYLPNSDSKQVVNPTATSTSTTANAYDTKVDTTTQDPNIMIDNNTSPATKSETKPETQSATTPSVGGKNDY